MKQWASLPLLLTALLLASCLGNNVSPPTSRRSNWWNIYQMAHAQLARGEWQAARENFERCLGIRSGATFPYGRDHWRVRTYGMHQLENYFPNRELAVALLQLGRPDEAEGLLLRSLEQEPSDRAKYYLNLCRTRLMQGASLPRPRIVLDQRKLYSNVRSFQITGEAFAPGRVASIEIQGIEERESLAEPHVRFSRSAFLPEGVHHLPIIVKDLLGNVHSEDVEVVVDLVAPAFRLAAPAREAEGWRIQGILTDEHGLKEISLDGRNLLPDTLLFPQSLPVNLFIRPQDAGVLKVQDVAGNLLEMNLSDADLGRWLGGKDIQIHAGPLPPEPAPFTPRLTLLASNTVQQVSEDRVFLNGEVVDPDGVRSVSVNGHRILDLSRASCQLVRFASWVPLQEGTNRIELTALGEKGRRQQLELSVRYVIPRYTRSEYRLSATIPPFYLPLNASPHPTLLAHVLDSFLQESPSHPTRFQILARGPEFEDLLHELRISRSDLSDPRARIPFAKLATSDLFLNGEVLPDAGGITLRLHTILTAEGVCLASDDIYLDEQEKDVQSILRGLASKVERRFPLTGGKILRVQSGNAWLELPESMEIPQGSKLLVIHPESLEGVAVLPGFGTRIELHMLDAKRGLARIEPEQGVGMIRAGDPVYTR